MIKVKKRNVNVKVGQIGNGVEDVVLEEEHN